MSLDYFLAYAVTVFIVVLIPGPVVMMIVSYGLARGREAALRAVVGVTLGDFTAMTLSLSGLGAVLATSATLFTILKVAGALYLIWLGIGLLRSKLTMDAEQLQSSSRSIFWTAYWVTALKPQEHHLLRRLPAAVYRSDAADPAATRHHGSRVPGARHAQCACLCIGRKPGPQGRLAALGARLGQPDGRRHSGDGRPCNARAAAWLRIFSSAGLRASVPLAPKSQSLAKRDSQNLLIQLIKGEHAKKPRYLLKLHWQLTSDRQYAVCGWNLSIMQLLSPQNCFVLHALENAPMQLIEARRCLHLDGNCVLAETYVYFVTRP